MPNIFKKRILDEKLKNFQIENFEEKIEIVKRWHFDFHKGTLKTDKETSREQAFNQDFFIKILGYQEKPKIPYTLEPKQTTEKGQLPDLVLGYFDNEKNNPMAVVELKGASIPLDRPQRREGNMSPIQQAFKYKSQYKICPFVLASNFFEFRLFQDNQLDYEIWTLDDLVNPENDFYFFKKFCFLLQADNFVTKEGKSKIEELIADIRIDEENISKSFYKEYKELRLELLRDIWRKNEIARKSIDLAIEKAQKIIDRIVFVCFCEDKGLLPEFILQRVLKNAEDNFGSLWSSLKGFFESIDKGSEKLEIPNGYNGGLFAKDNDLDQLEISDVILKKLTQLGRYNFEEDMSVSILGHIFEQSISDLEEIKLKANSVVDSEQWVMTPCLSNKDGKRKKDGIFYTPDYIVDYIIKNSLGKYLIEKENELKKKYNLKADIQDETYAKREKLVYEEYKKVLENVKVLDPACGSGAFLVKVFDFLLAENKRVADILSGQLFLVDDYLRSILKNNIFGVDINQESVEITKLSLWLKTAVKGKKLTTLDGNIKCGNSLIADVEVVGKKAFDWNVEFAEVMKNGGFDVIVGNPPYFNIQTLGAKSKIAGNIQANFPEIWQDKSDIIFYFIAKSIQLSKSKVCFIVSNAFLFSDKAKKLRNYILEKTSVEKITNFEKYMVFDDASITTAILELNKNKSDKKALAYSFKERNYKQDEISQIMNEEKNYFEVEFKKDDVFALTDGKISKLNNKIDGNYKKLNTLLKVGKGMETAANQVFIFENYPKEFPKEFIKKRMSGEIIEKYGIGKLKEYILYFENVENFEDLPKSIQEHLLKNKEFLENRADKKRRKTAKWWNYTFPMHKEFYNLNKIWCSYRAKENVFCFDDTKDFIGLTNTTVIFDTNKIIDLRYLVALLNSKVLNFRYKTIGKQTGSGIFEYFENGVGKLPIPEINKEKQQPFIILVDEILELKQKIQDYKELLIEAEKDNNFDREIKLRKEIELFENKVVEIEKKIDDLVFELYDLSEEERGVITNN